MKAHTITAGLCQTVFVGEAEREVELEFTVIAEMHYSPAQTSGPPENCYPEESECNITSLKITKATEDGKPVHLGLDTMAQLRELISLDRVEEQLWEIYQEALAPSDEY